MNIEKYNEVNDKRTSLLPFLKATADLENEFQGNFRQKLRERSLQYINELKNSFSKNKWVIGDNTSYNNTISMKYGMDCLLIQNVNYVGEVMTIKEGPKILCEFRIDQEKDTPNYIDCSPIDIDGVRISNYALRLDNILMDFTTIEELTDFEMKLKKATTLLQQKNVSLDNAKFYIVKIMKFEEFGYYDNIKDFIAAI